MSADSYSADHAAIKQDLEQAVQLDFAAYVGFAAHYSARLRELAAKHPHPEGAFLHLRGYADEVLEQLSDR
ncbi:MAG: hypothetical protein JO362_14345 [Streptomycetaceae bacterium]|nr:hypothetical protein [Streptomycetaceae bacterium]